MRMDALFLKLLNMSISAGWLILAVIVLRLLLQKAPKWTRCALWAMAALRLICPFSIESVFSLIPSAETLSPQTVKYAARPEIHSGVPVIDNTLNPVIGESFAARPEASVNPLFVWMFIASILWVAGAALMLIFALAGYLRTRRNVREAVLLRENIWLCDAVASPFLLGILRPRIYLPSGISGEQMEYVLAHERAHLKRKDHIWKALGYLLLMIYWFHPLVWAAYILFCKDVEMACDEKVAKNLNGTGKKAYSNALLSCGMQRKMVIACPLAFGEVNVKERVRSVLNYKKPAFWVVAVAVVCCAAVGVCFLTDPKQRVEASGSRAEDDAEGQGGSGTQDGAGMQGGSGTQEDTGIQDGIGSQGSAGIQDDGNKEAGEESQMQGQLPDAAPLSITGYAVYDALIAEAKSVLEDRDKYTGEHFSSVFYDNWDYETLGYLLRDLDGDGVEELIFGENSGVLEGWNGIIYDLYTIVDGKLVHILDGWERNRYYLCENGCIANESESSAFESTHAYYKYEQSGLKLIEAVIHHIDANGEEWFYSTEYTDQWYYYEEKPSPDVYYEITAEDADAVMAKYVHEYPQFTSFEEP